LLRRRAPNVLAVIIRNPNGAQHPLDLRARIRTSLALKLHESVKTPYQT